VVAAAEFILVVQNLGDSPSTVPMASAEVFERAAHAAGTKPFVGPRRGPVDLHGGPLHELGRRFAADPPPVAPGQRRRLAIEHRGEIKFIDGPKRRTGHPARRGLFDGYEALKRLPTDPDAPLRWAYRQAKNVEGAGLTEDDDVYAIFSGILGRSMLPPDLEAGIPGR
jgi:hypothetical protein